MKTALYPARIHQNKMDKVFYVQFLDLKNGFTFGETLEQAKEMAADVLSALLASYIEHNEKFPKPRKHKGNDICWIAPDAKVQAALLLRWARATRTQGEIARL